MTRAWHQLNLRHLLALTYFASTRSMRRVALKVGLTVPPLVVGFRKLEASFGGTPLLAKSRQRLAPLGVELAFIAQNWVAEVNQIRQDEPASADTGQVNDLARLSMKQLRNYLAIVEHRSVGIACLALGVSQPDVRLRLAKLEAILGVQLVAGRGILSITPEGYSFAKSVSKLAERLTELLDGETMTELPES